MSYYLLLIIVLACAPLNSKGFSLDQKSEREQNEITQRLKDFYQRPPKAGAMDTAVPKYDAATGEPVQPNPHLRIQGQAPQDLLLRQAQVKATPKYQKERCTTFLSQKFPEMKCDGPVTRETAKAHDQVRELARSWIDADKIAYSLDNIPAEGSIGRPFWSSDYWSMRAGLTSYRYASGIYYSTYKEAVNAYRQPAEWETLLAAFDLDKIAAVAFNWSPAEKYDLMTGDESFTLANEQKDEGQSYLGEDGNVEGWFGICHGWAPASVFASPPLHPVTAVSARGVKVTWYPDDIRAMVTLAWANGRFVSNFVGGRCNAKEIKRFPNGRISQSECFDNNPATFHVALGNLIGKYEIPFIMDAAFDYTVWNQPVVKYEFEYFNPLDVTQKSSRWNSVAVPYDQTFKEKDRFQSPKTRGKYVSFGNYDDSGIRQIVGVIASVSYLAETSARHSPASRENNVVRVSYTYDLELHEKNGMLVALGGEWHENAHPDFLWVPKKDSVPLTQYDYSAPQVDLELEPTEALADVARSASTQGYPLCNVLAPLVKGSTGGAPYRCPAQ